MPPESDSSTPRRPRAVRRILGGAGRLLSRSKLRATEALGEGPGSVADHLLLRAHKATFEEMHQHYTEKASQGESGLNVALDGFDTMWRNIRHLRAGAPRVLKTLTSEHGEVQAHRAEFYADSTRLLEDAIRVVFAGDLGALAVPPERMAVLVRVVLEGLVVELAQARTPEDVAAVDQIYEDVRVPFERYVLAGDTASALAPVELEPIPLPW